MPAQKFPIGASQEVQEAFHKIWMKIDSALGTKNVDWRGRRIINAGDAVQDGDYVTKRQLTESGTTVTTAIANQNRTLGWLTMMVRQQQSPDLLVDQGLGDLLWPVDSVFITSTDENPAMLLGFGTWELVGVGAGPSGGSLVITLV
jgi:baseplate structural protein gp10